MDNQIQKTDNFTINYFNPQHLDSVQRIAMMFSSSNLVPDNYRIDKVGKDKAIANTIIALDMASRMNANPLMIMQNLILIQGKPSWMSKFLIAKINDCGKFESLQYHFESKGKIKNIPYIEYQYQNGRSVAINKTFTDEVENIVCYAYTNKLGKQDKLDGSEISIEMAIREGWYTKNGSKWPIIPKQMLMYRAASFWCSVYAPELSMGIKTQEENQDIEDVEAIPVNDSIDKFEKSTEIKDQEPENKQPEQKTLMHFSSVANDV